MARFPQLFTELLARVDDSIRLDATHSFASNEVITNVEIETAAAAGFVSVFNAGDSRLWYLDFAYSTAGTKVVSTRVTSSAGSTTSFKNIEIKVAADDIVLSDDNDLFNHEPQIINWLPAGKTSWLYVHRLAKDIVLNDLAERRVFNSEGKRLTIANLVDKIEFKEWSKFETLALVFESLSNQVGDIFAEKAVKYGKLRDNAKSLSTLRYDVDGDGETDMPFDSFSGDIIRR